MLFQTNTKLIIDSIKTQHKRILNLNGLVEERFDKLIPYFIPIIVTSTMYTRSFHYDIIKLIFLTFYTYISIPTSKNINIDFMIIMLRKNLSLNFVMVY